MDQKRVFGRLLARAISDNDKAMIETRALQLLEAGASEEGVEKFRAIGRRHARLRESCGKRMATREIGLRALTRMVAEGATIDAIEHMRAWNAEDEVPDEAIDAAYELGLERFDAKCNGTPHALA
ncbi:MAG: hypothetical protein Q7S02_03555 [bacterium]|nr:hypothetical protein [bacterium]